MLPVFRMFYNCFADATPVRGLRVQGLCGIQKNGFAAGKFQDLGRDQTVVDDHISGIKRRDLKKLERILMLLEQQHGQARKTPANFRLLLDGALLGQIGFIYNRKHQEVLAARILSDSGGPGRLFPDLMTGVDLLSPNQPDECQ